MIEKNIAFQHTIKHKLNLNAVRHRPGTTLGWSRLIAWRHQAIIKSMLAYHQVVWVINRIRLPHSVHGLNRELPF